MPDPSDDAAILASLEFEPDRTTARPSASEMVTTCPEGDACSVGKDPLAMALNVLEGFKELHSIMQRIIAALVRHGQPTLGDATYDAWMDLLGPVSAYVQETVKPYLDGTIQPPDEY